MSTSIRLSYSVAAPHRVVWRVLTDAASIRLWTGAPAAMDLRVGGRFSLWKGDIHGRNLAIKPSRELVQEWFGGDWPKPSRVTIRLAPSRRGTKVSLRHAGVPAAEVKLFAEGWRLYYFGPLLALAERQARGQ